MEKNYPHSAMKSSIKPSIKLSIKTIVVSTGNAHKLREIGEIFSDLNIDVISINEAMDSPPEIIEDGDTFEANAIKKIVDLPEKEGVLYLADDSGIVVEALNGEPGVFSARYAGEGATDLENSDKLLNEMIGKTNRKAYFCCVIAIKTAEGEIQTFRGEVHGMISDGYYGEGGFGYDPLFIPEGFSQTFAQCPAKVKHQHSHRGRALEAFKTFLLS